MSPVRRDLHERIKHEAAKVHCAVRNHKTATDAPTLAPRHHSLIIGDDIEIEGASRPPPGATPAEAHLDRLQNRKKRVGCEACPREHRCIGKHAFTGADRRCSMNARTPEHFNPMLGQLLDRRRDHPLRCAEATMTPIGTKRDDGDRCHATRLSEDLLFRNPACHPRALVPLRECPAVESRTRSLGS